MAEREVAMKRPLPPAILLISMIVMVLLHLLAPGLRVHSWFVRAPGALLIVGGIAMSAWGSAIFQRVGTNIKPFDRPGHFVRQGPFRFSRNPMYLGFAVALLGLWLFLGSATSGVVVASFVWVIQTRFILFEERMMTSTFGEDYLAYCRRTRRWI